MVRTIEEYSIKLSSSPYLLIDRQFIAFFSRCRSFIPDLLIPRGWPLFAAPSTPDFRVQSISIIPSSTHHPPSSVLSFRDATSASRHSTSWTSTSHATSYLHPSRQPRNAPKHMHICKTAIYAPENVALIGIRRRECV